MKKFKFYSIQVAEIEANSQKEAEEMFNDNSWIGDFQYEQEIYGDVDIISIDDKNKDYKYKQHIINEVSTWLNEEEDEGCKKASLLIDANWEL